MHTTPARRSRRHVELALLVVVAGCSGKKSPAGGGNEAGVPATVHVAPVDSPRRPTADRSWTWSHDFDGDGRRDIVEVDYTGGAHCCYKLAVKLSASGGTVAIPFELDGGYVGGLTLEHPENFTVDVGRDGVSTFMMRIASYGGRAEVIPLEWVRAFGVRSHRARVSLRGGKLAAENVGWACDEAIEALRARRLGVWEGWPAACSLAEVMNVQAFEVSSGDDATLGSTRVAAQVRRLTMLQSDGSTLTWAIYHQADTIRRIDLDERALGSDVAELVDALGKPEARLAYTRWGFKHPTGHWVWASRGLAVHVDRTSRKILHAAVFTPGDVAAYKRDLM